MTETESKRFLICIIAMTVLSVIAYAAGASGISN